MINFGVGCFTFGLRHRGEDTTTIGAYCNALERALYQLPHIVRGSLNIEHSNESSNALPLDEEIANFNGGESGPALPNHFRLSFQLSLPSRVQNEVLEQLKIESDLPPEISVLILDTFFDPVAFVRFQHPSRHLNPSLAVVVVREYLERELSNDGSVYFLSRGPSPFHADFCFKQLDGAITTQRIDRGGFLSRTIPQRGYDRVEFEYLPGRYSDDEAAFDSLVDEIEDELGLFYLIVSFNSEELTAWPEVEAQFSEILKMSAERGFWAEIKTFFLCQRKIRSLYIDLTGFQITRSSNQSRIKSHYKDVYRSDPGCHLQSFVDREISERNEFPTAEVLGLVEFLERRYMKTWEVTILAIASMVGVLLGTSIFGK